MSTVGIAYQNNHDLDQPEIVNLLVTGFSGTLRGWWDSYLTEESRDSIRHAVKKNDEGLPIFYDDLPEIKIFFCKSQTMSFTKNGIQDLLLLICSLKKEFVKHSFLFLLISFMNGILMVCLNKKSLIK